MSYIWHTGLKTKKDDFRNDEEIEIVETKNDENGEYDIAKRKGDKDSYAIVHYCKLDDGNDYVNWVGFHAAAGSVASLLFEKYGDYFMEDDDDLVYDFRNFPEPENDYEIDIINEIYCLQYMKKMFGFKYDRNDVRARELRKMGVKTSKTLHKYLEYMTQIDSDIIDLVWPEPVDILNS